MAEQGTTAQARDKAQEVAGQAQEKAQEAASEARHRLRAQVDQRSTQAGEQVRSQAGDLRTVGQQLREQGKEQPAKLADQAADRLERAGGWLTESDADRILGDVEDFARRQPWAVMAGGLALGFVASRFLKASSRDRYQARRIDSSRQIPARTGQERFTRPAGTPGTGVGGPGQPATSPAGTTTTPPAPSIPPTGPGTGTL
jgi:ElaB/YqjD/DUF883 family membrane-anchored ribosome-binding protein